MKIQFAKDNGGERSPASLFAALVLVALVPAACVVWFMTVAMRNERFAVQEKLTAVYLNQIAVLQRQLTAHWKDREAALQSAVKPAAGETFAAIVNANLADGVVIYATNGSVLYPSSNVTEPSSSDGIGEWAAARELEFQTRDYAAAAEAFLRIARAAPHAQAKAQALQSVVGCYLKSGDKIQALNHLAELTNDPNLRNAVSSHGALITPNARLLILKLLAGDEALPAHFGKVREESLDDLVKKLNDYSEPDLSSDQRQFLMTEVLALAPNAATFPTLGAEQMAADYLDRAPSPPTERNLQRAPLAKTWRLANADRTIVALYREDRLRKEMTALTDALALSGVAVTLLAPDEPFRSSSPIAPRNASEWLPGWRLGLRFVGEDPLVTAAARQTRFYLGTGFLTVLIIAIVAILVARFVGAQMRLARMKNELLSMVSHELKTPLASMRALVDTLAAGRFRGEEQLQEYLQLIAKENLRLSQLIERFLAFSRMERGQQRFQFEELSPASVVRAAVEVMKEKLESPHCQFELSVAPDLPKIRGDAEALATMLINLLDNACKYTSGEKRIMARAYAEDRHVWFEVADNGIGLSPAEARKIFDRFYQVDQSLTRQQGGCGLGLSIVKSIVEAHHGKVKVRSEPGKGSVFRVCIPVVNASSIEDQPS